MTTRHRLAKLERHRANNVTQIILTPTSTGYTDNTGRCYTEADVRTLSLTTNILVIHETIVP